MAPEEELAKIKDALWLILSPVLYSEFGILAAWCYCHVAVCVLGGCMAGGDPRKSEQARRRPHDYPEALGDRESLRCAPISRTMLALSCTVVYVWGRWRLCCTERAVSSAGQYVGTGP